MDFLEWLQSVGCEVEIVQEERDYLVAEVSIPGVGHFKISVDT
jgi:hypothetical protein